MHAIVDNRHVILPDHSSYPGLVLVRTTMSARHSTTITRRQLATTMLALMKERARRVPGILSNDGLKILLGKTSHLVRREKQRLDAQAASFVGRVIEDRSGTSLTSGQRVAGVSLTHPPDTELVLARSNFIFPLDETCPEGLASLVLYGGLAVYAADEAVEATDIGVGVAGTGVLADIVASVLLAAGRHVVRLADARAPFRGVSTKTSSGIQDTDLWIETEPRAAPRPIATHKVIGIAVPLNDLRVLWPRAASHVAASVGDVVRDGRSIVDLFFEDAEPDWPDFLEPNRMARYLKLVSAGEISSDSLPAPVDGSTLDSERVETHIERALSARSGVVLTRFQETSRSPDTRRLSLNADRPHRAVKTVSVVGAGEWPLGMILRQILRDERIALRGACDRRPEVLHLARQALPFEFLTTCYDDLLNDTETDLIVVAPYHGAHAPLAEAALRAGKYCFVEKPPVVDQEQLDSLVAAARAADHFLYVGYNRRFAPATATLLRQLEEESGPVTVDIVVRSVPLPQGHWYFWPSNGNRIISNTCHFIDYALQLAAPATPLRVTATPSSSGRSDANLVIAIEFDDGSIGSITYTNRGSNRRSIYYQSYQVMKGDVTGRIDDFARLRVHRKGRKVEAWRGAVDLGHRHQMGVVAEALVNAEPSPVPLDTMVTSATTLLAAAESARQREPISIQPPESISQQPPKR